MQTAKQGGMDSKSGPRAKEKPKPKKKGKKVEINSTGVRTRPKKNLNRKKKEKKVEINSTGVRTRHLLLKDALCCQLSCARTSVINQH
jgi:hypothetical protein